MRAIFPPEAEEQLKEEFFAGAARGFFVEVGANDPFAHSQTWHLERRGWTGVLVEPQPDLAAALCEKRRAAVFAAACSAPAAAGRTMRLHLAGPCSSFDAHLAVTGVTAAAAIDVPVRTLDDILTEAKAQTPIDFLSIDVEGHEVEVLRGFDIGRWRPRLIMLEDHVANLHKHRYLTAAGYRLIRRTGVNSWYVPAEAAPAQTWLGRWQLFRKFYLALPFRVLRDWKRSLRDRLRARCQRAEA